MKNNYYNKWRLNIALFEASVALHDFCTNDMLFLEPNKRNNYIWALVDVTNYSELDIKGINQQLLALEKDYCDE